MKTRRIKIDYKMPYNWQSFYNFKSERLIKNIEWLTENSYGSNFSIPNAYGSFELSYAEDRDYFIAELSISDENQLAVIEGKIKKAFDTDRDILLIERKLKTEFPAIKIESGIRLTGYTSFFEAGLRAICGQQVSIKGATMLINRIVEICDKKLDNLSLFPEPSDVRNMNFDLLKTMQSKKNSLKAFALWCDENNHSREIDELLNIKGIGIWTVNYIKMRALSDSNVWIENDLGIKKALKKFGKIDPLKSYPWASYLSLHLWNNLKEK